MKKIILTVIECIIFRYSEKCAPEVKYSELNGRVAEAILAVSKLKDFISAKQ